MRIAPTPGPLAEGQPRDAILAETTRALTVLPDGAHVVVASSGGPDSTALAFLTAEARPDLVMTLGHVRHGLRDDRADVAAVRTQAAFLGVSLEVVSVTVEAQGEGLEAAARAARYAALRRIAAAAGARWLLVGHTADDQAETVLMRVARGTGVPGLAGMAPVSGDLVRPLLRLRRSDVRRFVAEEGLPAVDDPTNADPAITRVRARHTALPALAALGPDPVGALGRLADLARIDAAKLDADARDAAGRMVRCFGPCAAVQDRDLAALDPAIATRLVRDLVNAVRSGDQPPTAAQVGAVLDLDTGAALDLPGVVVTRNGGWLAVGPRAIAAPAPRSLPVPGLAAWHETGAAVVAVTEATAGPPERPQLALDLGQPWRPAPAAVAEHLLPPGADPALGQVVLGALPAAELEVRARRPGDRILTAGGTRKLQDVLVDAGVPRVLRDLVPLVALADRVLWVPGLAVDADAAAAGAERPGVQLALVAADTTAADEGRPPARPATRRPTGTAAGRPH